MINSSDLFLKSALTEQNPFISTYDVLKWIKQQNDKTLVDVKEVEFTKLKQWKFQNGALKHETGGFFSIEGIKVNTNWGRINTWMQPIINQPEIGYLGFLTKEFDGVLYFLTQAKIEPGNVNYVQLSPTLQATKSNYERLHKGSAPLYLTYFQNARPDQILLDQLQSEQGARFLKKRNRNIVIRVEEEIEVMDNFIWLSLGQLKKLMSVNNVVNMDSRTVISGIPLTSKNRHLLSQEVGSNSINKFLESCIDEHNAINDFSDVISFITTQKCKYNLEISKIKLNELNGWIVTEKSIHHEENKYFQVIAADIKIGNREVVSWTQPMIKPAQEGICAFLVKEINGVLHLAVQAKMECGNFDIIELAPTVQCLTGNYKNNISLSKLPFLDYVLNASSEQIIYDTYQSEEGGRFFREQNRNLIIMAGEEFSEILPENFIWMTINQLQMFVQFNNYINIQARSLLAAVNFI